MSYTQCVCTLWPSACSGRCLFRADHDIPPSHSMSAMSLMDTLRAAEHSLLQDYFLSDDASVTMQIQPPPTAFIFSVGFAFSSHSFFFPHSTSFTHPHTSLPGKNLAVSPSIFPTPWSQDDNVGSDRTKTASCTTTQVCRHTPCPSCFPRLASCSRFQHRRLHYWPSPPHSLRPAFVSPNPKRRGQQVLVSPCLLFVPLCLVYSPYFRFV